MLVMKKISSCFLSISGFSPLLILPSRAVSISPSLSLPMINVSACFGCGCLNLGEMSSSKILATSEGVSCPVLGNILLLCLLNDENKPSITGVVALLNKLLCASPVCCCLSLNCASLCCKSVCSPNDNVPLSSPVATGVELLDDDEDDWRSLSKL